MPKFEENFSDSKEIIVLKKLEGNSSATLNANEKILAPYADGLKTAWWILWFIVLAVLVVKFMKLFLNRDK